LQGLVRLAEAHARSRLNPIVEKQDAQVAIRLMSYYLMHAGYDQETNTFDIDRISVGTSTKQRNKLKLIRETIKKLEEKFGKQVPLEDLRKEVKDLSDIDFEESIERLQKESIIFQPRSGFIQLM